MRNKKNIIISIILLIIFYNNLSAKSKFTFFDKFSGEKINVQIVEKKVCKDIVDDIIYFKKGKNIYKRIYTQLTPEMFGAKGDGITDDYEAIQNMLNKGEENCTFYFNGKKTYYNAFANKGLWIDPLKRNIWIRNKGAKFLFNGAKLRRRLPEWNDKNVKSNYNEGKYYTDDHTALLYLTGNNYIIDRADFNSNVPLGDLLDVNQMKIGTKDYAVGTCMEMGLWLDNCSNVTVTNSQFTNSVFPIYVTNGNNIKFDNLTLKFAAQANRRININDPAIGGGIKLMNCNNVVLNNVYGYRNLNNTVEIEPLNSNIIVKGKSDYDYDNSIVILSSRDINIDWEANYVQHGTGLLIKACHPNDVETKNIKGKIKVNTTSWCGVLIWLDKTATHNISNIDLNVSTTKTGYAGLYLNNENDKFKITGININHQSYNDGTGSGVARLINNSVEGKISGDTFGAGIGVKVIGKSSKTPISSKIKFHQNVLKKYDISPNAAMKKL